jgi:probable addiction module antidote protein
MKKYNNINDYIIEKLKDPEEAELYLNAALEDYFEDQDTKAFFACLKNLIKAKTSITDFSENAHINRSHLYDIFNSKVDPNFGTIKAILKKLGYKLQAKAA